MPRPKKVKVPAPPKVNKTKLVERLVEKPSQNIREWLMKEFVLLKRLEAKYPLEFLNMIDFGKKLPSLAVLSCEWGEQELARKYHAFSYQPPTKNKVTLLESKVGENVSVERKKSLRELL